MYDPKKAREKGRVQGHSRLKAKRGRGLLRLGGTGVNWRREGKRRGQAGRWILLRELG